MTDYVIATSRPWNEALIQRLAERTGETFHLITSPEALTTERLSAIAPRYVFFPHWSHKVPAEIHEHYECVIFHMTDLPYGRGGSPLQNLIQRGHQDTVISALRCVDEMDAGPIYMKEPLSLAGSATEIFQRAVGVIESMIDTMVQEQPKPEPQTGEPVYFKRRKPPESDLTAAAPTSLGEFFDFIRMLDADGYPRAYIDMQDHRIEFSQVEMQSDRLVGTFTISRRS